VLLLRLPGSGKPISNWSCCGPVWDWNIQVGLVKEPNTKLGPLINPSPQNPWTEAKRYRCRYFL